MFWWPANISSPRAEVESGSVARDRVASGVGLRPSILGNGRYDAVRADGPFHAQR